jgi:LPXTG-site transpeptidase (sortase) family protein
VRALVGILVGLLLLVAGCGNTPGAGPDLGSAPVASASAAPTTAGATPADADLSQADSAASATPSASPSATPTPQESAPSVPTVRATLPAPSPTAPPPSQLEVPSIDVDLPVVPVGVADDGEMELPGTVREVAWYSYGSRPGDAVGATVLAAHVDTKAEGLGPFVRLRELGPGDELVVTDAEGRAHRYQVTTITEVQKADLSLDRVFRRDGSPELVVVTCGGPFDRQTGYRDNVLVSARPL